jgi:hypothetical protein
MECLLAANSTLQMMVAEKLNDHWSPQQVSGWLKLEYLDDMTMRVSCETIYKSLFIQARGVLKKKLIPCLRSKRIMRRGKTSPFKTKPLNVGGSEEQPEEGTLRESNPNEDDPENSMSLAAIEAELKPKVLETFDAITDTFKRLRRLQDQDIHNKLHNESAGAGAQVQEARSIEHDSPLKSLACFRSK